MTTSDIEPAVAEKKAARAAGRGEAGGTGGGLPPRLVEPLRMVAGRARLLAFCRALFSFLTLASIVWLVATLVLGSRVQVPHAVAIPLVIGAWGMVLFAAWRLFRPVFYRPTITAAARLVDVALPDTQERISSAVEIAAERDPRFRGSPELVACLLRQAEHHADAMNPAAVISGGQVTRWFFALAGMLVVWFLLLVLLTPQVVLGLQRTFAPWLAAAAMPEPILAVAPGDVSLAQGQELTVTVEVKPPQGLSLDNGKEEIPAPTFVQHFTTSTGGIAVPDRSEPMERTGPRTFRTTVKAVQAAFTYQVLFDGGARIGQAKSAAYTVRVQARPGVAGIALTYTYPEYTKLKPRTEPSRERAIDTVVGTRVRVSVTPTQAVAQAMLQIDDNGSGPATVALTPAGAMRTNVEAVPPPPPGTPAAAVPAYEGEFTVNKTTQYRIKLVSAEGRDNPDAQTRPITARPDAPPQAAITSPGNAAPLRVRPDDTVPVRFTAADDFGVTRLEMLLQVDDAPATAVPMNGAADEPRVSGEWPLSIAEVLRIAGGSGVGQTGGPRRVFYQVRATDNRVPTPQTGLSARQVLELDRGAAPLAQRMESEAVKDLASAVAGATEKLRDAQGKLEQLQKAEEKPLSAADQQKLAQAKGEVADARNALNRAADAAEATRVSELGQQARDVATEPLRRAEEAAAGAQLAADQPAARKASTEQAGREVAEALRRLDGLSGALGDTSRNQPMAQRLEGLAQRQRELADKLAQNPNDPALQQQQRELQQEVEKLIRENPQLQGPAMAAQQQRVDALAEKLRQLEAEQGALTESARNLAAAGNLPEKAKELAKRQEELNRDIAALQGGQADPLKRVNGRTPPPEQMDGIVRDLQANRLSGSVQGQRAAASQMNDLANKLETAQRQYEGNADQRQKQAEQAQQAAEDAARTKGAVEDLSKQIADAKTARRPIDRGSDPVNQQAQTLAEQLKRQARALAQNPAAKEQAQAAEKSAEAARNLAGRGQAEAAQNGLTAAAGQLTQAAEAAQRAAGVGPNANAQPSVRAAAEKARDLAERQRALADETGELAKAGEDARTAAANPGAKAEQQGQLAERIGEAAREAQALGQQTQGTAPQLAERANKAAGALQQSAQAQREAAQATRAANPSQAAARQEQAAEALAQAEESLTGQPRARQVAERPRENPTSAPPPAPNSANRGGERQGTSNPNDPDRGNANRGGTEGSRGGTAPGPSNQNPSGQGQSAQGQAGQGRSGQGQSSQDGTSRGGNQAGGANGQASAGRGASSGGSPGGTSGNTGAAGGSSASSGTAGAQGSAATGGASASGGSGGSGASPGGAGQVANGGGQGAAGQAGDPAQAVQSAHSAQSEAARGNAAAARQAAESLSEASRHYRSAGAAGNTPGATGAAGANGSEGRANGSAAHGSNGPSAAAGGGSGGAAGGGGAGGGQGGSVGATGGGGSDGGAAPSAAADSTPEPVKNIGLTPSEWARLPAKMQEELLHTAQQPMPPSYREQIKNYYSRIARLQAEPR
jgi:hypothetical protein